MRNIYLNSTAPDASFARFFRHYIYVGMCVKIHMCVCVRVKNIFSCTLAPKQKYTLRIEEIHYAIFIVCSAAAAPPPPFTYSRNHHHHPPCRAHTYIHTQYVYICKCIYAPWFLYCERMHSTASAMKTNACIASVHAE